MMRSDKDAKRGLYNKYEVIRLDGSSLPGGKHARCRHFVLDMTHDQYAIPALRAYAKACRNTFPKLAADLSVWVEAHAGRKERR